MEVLCKAGYRSNFCKIELWINHMRNQHKEPMQGCFVECEQFN